MTVIQLRSKAKKHTPALIVPTKPPAITTLRTPYFCPKIPASGPENKKKQFHETYFAIAYKSFINQRG